MEQIIDEAAVSRFENETWSRCADSYPDTFQLLTGRTIALLVGATGIRPGTRVLDLGAGPGDGTAMLAETGAAVTGVDFSRTMVAAARRRHPGLTFHEGDAEVLPFADGAFDAIVSNFVVHHLARPALVFREVSRVLAPGGRFAFIVWASPEEQTGFGVFFAAVQAHHTLEALPHGPLFGVTDRAVYDKLAGPIGFSERILAPATDGLVTVRVKGVEWSDWGHPQRVMATMRRTGWRPVWLGRVELASAG